MKADNKNGKISRTTTLSKEYKIANNGEYGDWYSDEGVNYHPQYRKGFTKHNRRRIPMFKVRMYRTWKHNRKTKWKDMPS